MSQLSVAASTFPYLYSHSGLDALKHLNGLGYDIFELMIFPPHCWPRELSVADRKAYKSWLDGEGCRISSFCYPLLDNNPNGVDRLMRAYTLDRYREAIDLAAELECPYVVAIPGPVNSLINPPHEWMLNWFVEGMKQLVDYADGTGVQLLLENVPFTYLPTAKDMVETAKLIGPEVGINFDICNSAFIKEDPAEAIRMMGDMVKNVHISDSGYDEFVHAKLGTGIVDPGPVAAALKEIGFTGETVLEIIADALLPGTDPDGDIKASHAILAENGWKPLG
ncbi:sugar phosphate isomerase/epimerase family protein [Jannaschia seohaensis]|uniref:Sugar phosphate isomerase/epimerase n=1 Tax=Jannaschia seohaensis TaxID=475081 RepID=A0A2Y9AVN0_9RHOB|nr:sugar phosphate isomerase/epimerase family protein [Jannaschia seohaensis]PWJ17043.1 sugar phosphate isomerase/epimerase [Jannaschia seohaensis]SSA48380.1 Sugar phosphate isomerase/epimerase [Jannaschia seohaensis]